MIKWSQRKKGQPAQLIGKGWEMGGKQKRDEASLVCFYQDREHVAKFQLNPQLTCSLYLLEEFVICQ